MSEAAAPVRVFSHAKNVLVADDAFTDRAILDGRLSQWGYNVELAEDGDQAWEILCRDNAPQLAILDWMMPGHDGVEICRMLRERGGASYVYVILATGRDRKEDAVAGLSAGADDYLTKPIDPEELQCRLQVASRILDYEYTLSVWNKQLEAYASEMKQLADARAAQLIHADRMATLGVMAAGVAHEVNNPTSFISGNVQTLERFWQQLSPVVRQVIHVDEANRKQLAFILEETPQLLTGIRAGVKRIAGIVDALKIYSRKEQVRMMPVNVNRCIRHALEFCRNRLKEHVRVHLELDDTLGEVQGVEQQLQQVLINLFTNAADAIEEHRKDVGELYIRSLPAGHGHLQIQVQDNAGGIPEKIMDQIFSPFFTSKQPGKGTGLGLSISMGIIEKHGGTLKADNVPDGGARFTIELPLLVA